MTAISTPFLIATTVGVAPSILWLIFWFREDGEKNKEPIGLIALVFLAGALAVVCVLPIEKVIANMHLGTVQQITYWAASEELIKLLAFSLILHGNKYLDEPVEYPIYLMTVALGFAALENTLYLVHPLSVTNTTVSFLTGHLRFLGSTLLHSVTSGIIGISIGLAYFKDAGTRMFYGIIGICTAIALHSIFNFFIIKDGGKNFLQVFGFLWVVTIIIMLIFEKLRRMGSYANENAEPQTI